MRDSNTDAAVDAMALAKATALTMYATEAASRTLGVRIVDVAPGRAMLTMPVRAEMINGHDICHGGFIFAFADSALAFASNSYNIRTVTAGSTIDYLTPAYVGEVLTSVASEQVRSGRSGVYDVVVSKEDGTCVALFRGKPRQIQGEVVPPTVNQATDQPMETSHE